MTFVTELIAGIVLMALAGLTFFLLPAARRQDRPVRRDRVGGILRRCNDRNLWHRRDPLGRCIYPRDIIRGWRGDKGAIQWRNQATPRYGHSWSCWLHSS